MKQTAKIKRRRRRSDINDVDIITSHRCGHYLHEYFVIESIQCVWVLVNLRNHFVMLVINCSIWLQIHFWKHCFNNRCLQLIPFVRSFVCAVFARFANQIYLHFATIALSPSLSPWHLIDCDRYSRLRSVFDEHTNRAAMNVHFLSYQ